MKKLIRNLVIASVIVLTACRTNTPVQITDTESLAGLKAMGAPNGRARNNMSNGKIRIMALQETALSVGAQAGLAWRARCIDEKLIKEARRLDAIYDFNSLILQHNILPPVLLEGRNTLNLANIQTIRISDRVYKIARQARFVTTPPNWRQYLWMDYQKPEPPHQTLLPKTRDEQAIWANCVEQGWKRGVEQANTILEENIARIKEDFVGMILYRKLLAMNMISPPYVSHTELGVTGDGEEIHIDDRVLRITALPALNTSSGEWRAAVAREKNALEKFRLMEKNAKSAEINVTSEAWQPQVTTLG